jgi:DNA primase
MTDVVLELLQKNNLSTVSSGKDWLIRCLNPEHDDSNPSFRIDKTTGTAHCFSCGFKTNIFKYFGLTSVPNNVKIAKLKKKLTDLNLDLNGVEFPERQIPYTKSYRGISTATLKHFESFYTTTGEDKYLDRIWFPIKDLRNKTKVYVGRHTSSSGNPRYLNYPTGTTLFVYPERFEEKYKSLILVEGIFDMLNLYDNGLQNTSCTFGTSTILNNTALKLLPFKTQGIEKIYLMFDGDEPGQKAMQELQPLIEECGFYCEQIKLPEDQDPGSLSKEYIHSIKEYINEKDLRS